MNKMKTWFVSDLHFGHPNILYHKPKRRDAAGITLSELQADKKAAIEKHDKWLIEQWNKTISRNDVVYILGDFCLGNKEYTEKILQQLRGKKFLILGNHDKSCNGLERYFEWVGYIKEVKFNSDMYPYIDSKEPFRIYMEHAPSLGWFNRPHGVVHLHGHTHGSIDDANEKSLELRVDVGFDAKLCDIGFVELETVYKYMKSIIEKQGCETFKDYIEWKMVQDGYRM